MQSNARNYISEYYIMYHVGLQIRVWVRCGAGSVFWKCLNPDHVSFERVGIQLENSCKLKENIFSGISSRGRGGKALGH